MVEVRSLETGRVVAVYTLPAQEAVFRAYQQFILNDYNWWSTPLPKRVPRVEEGRWHFFCGQYAARKG